MADEIHGHYAVVDRAFVPDAAMVAIQGRLAEMRLLADAGYGVPSFYVDRVGDIWERTHYEDRSARLRRVSREYIETSFPSVDPDRPIT